MTAVNGTPSAARSPVLCIAAAGSITVLDGFDAFSLSLMAPHMRTDLGIAPAYLGPIFSSALTGMIIGAFTGGMLGDRFGRLQALIAALAIFGGAALLLPLVTTAPGIMANRLSAGIGLGAAAPIAVALLNRSSARAPSDFIIACVWAGIPVGGILAALYNQAAVPVAGWRSIFIIGGLLPLPVAAFAVSAFRNATDVVAGTAPTHRSSIGDLFAPDRALRSFATAAMFFFGYVSTSIIVNWLPTILSERSASPFLISSAFAAMNVGAVVGILSLGLIASKSRWLPLLPLTWTATALFGLATLAHGIGTNGIALLAVLGATAAAGAQGLAIVLANGLHRDRGLEGTTIGFMTGTGRIGQASALAGSGLVMGLGGQDTLVFGMAGISALIAAALALVATMAARSAARGLRELSAPGD